MAKRPSKKESKAMNDLLRASRGFVVEETSEPDDEVKKKRKAQHDEMNARLRAAAHGFSPDDIEGS
jgi:hypothetical protein